MNRFATCLEWRREAYNGIAIAYAVTALITTPDGYRQLMKDDMDLQNFRCSTSCQGSTF